MKFYVEKSGKTFSLSIFRSRINKLLSKIVILNQNFSFWGNIWTYLYWSKVWSFKKILCLKILFLVKTRYLIKIVLVFYQQI